MDGRLLGECMGLEYCLPRREVGRRVFGGAVRCLGRRCAIGCREWICSLRPYGRGLCWGTRSGGDLEVDVSGGLVLRLDRGRNIV